MEAPKVIKRLISSGLPAKWLVPVLDAIFDDGSATKGQRRRKRRTKAQMARDAGKGKAKAGKKKRRRKVAATAEA